MNKYTIKCANKVKIPPAIKENWVWFGRWTEDEKNAEVRSRDNSYSSRDKIEVVVKAKDEKEAKKKALRISGRTEVVEVIRVEE